MTKKNYTVDSTEDVNGRWHVWIVSTERENLATTDDLYAEARKIVPDFAHREFDLSAETLLPGRFHLTEKGFISHPTIT